MMDVDMDAGASGLPGGGIYGQRSVKLWGAKARGGLLTQDAYPAEKAGPSLGVDEYRAKEEVVKHYDADVLAKVFVYCGIGMLACGIIPVMFEVLGWGVRLR
ncbi:hypothetical protein FOMPIDRAFT_1045084 [Fomitopsis schrenkii]|uniref:Uncharacterized protein n=1 Tax=Fomitopsis schrenkii TaxID=2126942 RepID=S8EKZ8_FOMSC|nr:hypothetical protein FOMPIDRAFT_1045074 [Fomitopsis schrenkii]EPT05783.1 hypothetical protein FOMPIDRAFT_1045084 [Fomitopsis schrenkii]